MQTIILNNTNVLPNTNNGTYRYTFPGGGVNFNNKEQIAVQSLVIPYSWFNISAFNQNNSFSYILNAVSYNVPIQNGFYTIDDVNTLFQNAMFTNGHYLLNSNGDPFYFAQIRQNISQYANEYDAYAIPITLPSNYTNPANVLYNTVTFSTPTTIQLVIPNTNFQNYIGLKNGNYPASPQTVNYAVVSNITPVSTPVNSLIIRCSAVNNICSIPTDIFFSFSPNTTFGSNIVIAPQTNAWISIKQGTYFYLDFTICDQNYNPIYFNDNNVCFQFLIKDQND